MIIKFTSFQFFMDTTGNYSIYDDSFEQYYRAVIDWNEFLEMKYEKRI